MTKVCFLSSAHPKFDKRVFKKEAVWLANAGYDVSHICPDETAQETTAEGVTIKTYTRRGGLVGRVLNAPRLFKLARAEKADALHANELDSWLVALAVKLFTRTRVVFDVHEFYPSMFAETRMPRALAPAAEGAFRLMYRVLGPATDLIVLANRYIRSDFPAKADNIVNVENFAVLETANIMKAKTKPPRGDTDPFRLIHVGLMAVERGSVVIPQAISKLPRGSATVHMIGNMTDMSNDAYRAKIKAEGTDAGVHVVDWLTYENLIEELVASDAGIVFFQSGSETNAYGLPHKLFDYMAAGLPVLVSTHAKYVAEIVSEADCGLIIDSEKPDEIVTAIQRLIDNPEEARRLGDNGRKALFDKFNWDGEFRKLTDFYGTLGKAPL